MKMAEFAVNMELAPHDPFAMCSEEQIASLPDPATQKKAKKDCHMPQGSLNRYLGFGSAATAHPEAQVKPLTFKQNTSKGDPAVDNSLLKGKGPQIEQYLIAYIDQYNGKHLPTERQLNMLLPIWRIVNGKDPKKKDEDIDRQMPALFKRRMITPPGPSQTKMGLENWWKHHSHTHRARSCMRSGHQMRCLQVNDEESEKVKKLKPHCTFCNTEHWGSGSAWVARVERT